MLRSRVQTYSYSRCDDNLNYSHDIASLEQTIQSEGRKLSDLNPGEFQLLETIASQDLPISAKAQVLLSFNNIPIYKRPIKKLSDAEM